MYVFHDIETVLCHVRFLDETNVMQLISPCKCNAQCHECACAEVNPYENDITIRKTLKKNLKQTLTVSFTVIGISFMKLISSCMKLVK